MNEEVRQLLSRIPIRPSNKHEPSIKKKVLPIHTVDESNISAVDESNISSATKDFHLGSAHEARHSLENDHLLEPEILYSMKVNPCLCESKLNKKSADLYHVNYFYEVQCWLRTQGKKEEAKMTLEEREMYKKIFNMLDEDGSGTLDTEEISVAMKLVGVKISKGQLRRDIFGYSKDGQLNFAAFIRIMDVKTKTIPSKPSNSKPLTGDSPRKHERKMSSHSSASSAESSEEILPFNLWVPAFQRRKNIDFVMELKLRDGRKLPYNSSVSDEKPPHITIDSKLPDCTCGKFPTKLVVLEKILKRI